MKSIAFALACLSGTQALSMHEHQFISWAVQHSRQYADVAEFKLRFQNWLKTHEDIEAANARDGRTVTLGHNKFSDFTEWEYRSLLNYQPKTEQRKAQVTYLDASNNPDSVDWVAAGAVNEVQDQANCGSCWAFSAIASMEGQHFVQTGELLKLSEQQCVDCDSDSYGCGGGW